MDCSSCSAPLSTAGSSSDWVNGGSTPALLPPPLLPASASRNASSAAVTLQAVWELAARSCVHEGGQKARGACAQCRRHLERD
jgi:hypothetical protein